MVNYFYMREFWVHPLGYFFGYLQSSVDYDILNFIHNLADFVKWDTMSVALCRCAPAESVQITSSIGSFSTPWWLHGFQLVVLLDWFMLLIDAALKDIIGIFRISEVLGMSRIIRLFRLLCMFTMPALADDVSDYIQSECLFIAFGVLKELVIVAIMNHFIACGWYAVGIAFR